MDNLEIILPSCGFMTFYHNIKDQPDTFKCLICDDHEINKDECLNIKRNKIIILKKKIELQIEKFNYKNQNLSIMSMNPSHYIEKSFEVITNELDLRREKLKQEIDDYFFKLFNQIKQEKEAHIKLCTDKSVEKSHINLDKDQIDNLLKQSISIDVLNGILEEVEEKLSVLDEEISNLEIGKNYKLHLPYDPIKIQKLFGNLEINGDVTRVGNYECFQSLECEKKIFSPSFFSINKIKFFNDDTILSLNGQCINIWDKKSGKCLKSIYPENSNRLCVLNSYLFATGTSTESIKVFDIRSYKCIKNYRKNQGSIQCLKLLKSGDLVSLSKYSIQIWNLQSEKCLKEIKDLSQFINCLEETSCGNLLTAHLDRRIKIWEPNKGHILNEFTVHTSLIICLKMMGKSILAIAFEDHTFKIWNYITKTCIKTFLESDVTCLDKLNDSLLVIGTAYGKIKIFNVNTQLYVGAIDSGLGYVINDLSINNKKEIATISNKENSIKIWKRKDF
ncbi:unnamed protein product [Brachionus calyciflorus]|uniref:Uncharacterized protein n=1 Tax=Brachionus calyciflorus TaxID=104777 RepID=A0A814LSR5_9BILA|nr:unnamed protein product [Brachionus calyciflorus]